MTHTGLSVSQAHAARQGLSGAVATSAQLPDRIGRLVLSGAREAFTDGMNVVSLVGAGVLVAAAVATAVLLRDADRVSHQKRG
jgi:DHA2 family multidrug resistance protein-like MFS transporter